MAEATAIGIIGCGNISDAYLRGAARSGLIRVKSVASRRMEQATAKAREHGVEAVAIDALLADPEIAIVLNLTPPLAHAAINLAAVDAGKHLYSEKPLAARLSEAKPLLRAAAVRKRRVGCAPDTFLGGAHQACRRALDAGRIGTVVAGAASFLSHGMERWHPNPGFFFQRGGGPALDVGPYYVTTLVNLLGPVKRVAALASTGNQTRTIGSEPFAGQTIDVRVPTTVNAVLEFAGGANVSLTASWDVWRHGRPPIELYGSEGSMLVPDPDFFGGEPKVSKADEEWEAIDIAAHPFGANTRTNRRGLPVADYRIIGLLDMARAIETNRPHRANGALALHVLEVLEALEHSSTEGRHIIIETPCERPDPVPLGTGEEVF